MACSAPRLRGISLCETMLALTLSAVLLLEIFRYTYFLENSAQYSAARVAAAEKENVLFAWMGEDIEKAGYMTCVAQPFRKKIIDDTGRWHTAALSTSSNRLFVQYMSPQSFVVLEQRGAYTVQIADGAGLKEQDLVVLADCTAAQILKIKQMEHLQSGAFTNLTFFSPIKIYPVSDTLYLGRLLQHDYFLQQTQRKNAQGEWITALYMRDDRQRSDEILENIQALQFSFWRHHGTMTVYIKDYHAPMVFTLRAYNA